MGRRDAANNGRGDGSDRPNCAKEPYLEDWDQYFHSIALAVAQKSKDPRCRVGAVIVSPDRLVLATGFNGLARGVFDAENLLADVEEKLRWICHAETNAIFNAARTGVAVKGCTVFVTKFPCFPCCNAIVQAGVQRLYTLDDTYWDDDEVDGIKCVNPHTRKAALLKQARVQVDAPRHVDFNARWRILFGSTTSDTQAVLPGTAPTAKPPTKMDLTAPSKRRRRSS